MRSIFVSICDLKDLIDLQIFNKKRYKPLIKRQTFYTKGLSFY